MARGEAVALLEQQMLMAWATPEEADVASDCG